MAELVGPGIWRIVRGWEVLRCRGAIDGRVVEFDLWRVENWCVRKLKERKSVEIYLIENPICFPFIGVSCYML